MNGQVRLLEHDKSIVEEDDLDTRWEHVTGEVVTEIIFLSKHTAVTNRPALTVHPIGIYLFIILTFNLRVIVRNKMLLLCFVLRFECNYITLND